MKPNICECGEYGVRILESSGDMGPTDYREKYHCYRCRVSWVALYRYAGRVDVVNLDNLNKSMWARW